ncbi:MAG: hypothetical protein RXO24_07965 [Acidilobus sp.]
MTKFRGYNVIKVYLSDEQMAQVDLAVQYFKLRKSGPQSYNALLIHAFDRLVESDPGLKAFIENSLKLVKEQQQQAGQEGGGQA